MQTSCYHPEVIIITSESQFLFIFDAIVNCKVYCIFLLHKVSNITGKRMKEKIERVVFCCNSIQSKKGIGNRVFYSIFNSYLQIIF